MSSQIHSSPSFSPLSTLSGVSLSPAPEVPPADLVPEDLRQLGVKIVSGGQEDRELAVDILVNLAAGNDGRSKEAQAVLTDLHADPGKFADANGLQAHGKQEIRNGILSAAHRMCELALNAAGHEGGGLPLSMTVAYLGARCDSPPSGNVMQDRIKLHIDAHTRGQRLDLPQADKLLEPGRPVGHAELGGAAAGFRNLQVHPHPLAVRPCDPAPAPESNAPAVLAGMRIALAGAPSPGCQAAWINAGDAASRLWMPLVLQKDSDGNTSCHLVDASPEDGGRETVHGNLRRALEGAGFEQGRIHVHEAHTPPNHPAGDEGPLCHRLLQALDAAPGDAGNSPARSEEAMTAFIREYSKSWSGGAEPADREALVLAARAELLESCSMQPAPVVASPLLSAPAFDPAKIVAPGPGADGAVQVRKPSGPSVPAEAPLTQAEKQELAGLVAAVGFRQSGAGVISMATDLARSMNQQLKVEPGGDFLAVMRNQPAAVRTIAADFSNAGRLGDVLKRSALLNEPERGSALASMFDKSVPKSLGESLHRLGGYASVAQIPTRFELLLKNLAEAAEEMASGNRDVSEKARVRFKGLANELAPFAGKLRESLADSIRGLKAIEETPQYGGIRLRWANRNGVSTHDPALQREAGQMRRQFEILKKHLEPGSLLDQWSKLGEYAKAHPAPTAASLRAAASAGGSEQLAAIEDGVQDVGGGYQIVPESPAIDVGAGYEIRLDSSTIER